MKDGYYISAYLAIDLTSRIQFKDLRHDQNFALWKKSGQNIELIEYYELERYTGYKHHRAGFSSIQEAKYLINSLLSQRGLSLEDVCEIFGMPVLQSGCELFEEKEYSYHSLCHLYSTLLMDTEIFNNEKILCFAVDGGPDFYLERKSENKHYYCGCYSDCSSVTLFPSSSPAVMWYIFSYLFNSEEGSLMALGSANTSKLKTPPDPVIHNYINHDDKNTIEYVAKAQKRIYDILNNKSPEKITNMDNRFTQIENAMSMTMKKVQEMSLTIMRENIQNAIYRFKIDPNNTYLAMSGGFALNCPANSTLVREFGFKGFICTPCPNDSGQSLGIGLYAFYKRMDNFKFHLAHAYYGYADNRNVESVINKEFTPYIASVTAFTPEQAAEDICTSPIVWFNSCAEIGPRALGNRSILGDPRSEQTKEILNNIKQRQWWRPVAPVVLEENLHDWFEDAWISPFMLNTFLIRKEKINDIPAVAHMDRSARVQTLKQSDNPVLYSMIKAFKKRTGIPILCNTSLNDKGEPIINTIEEALNFALRKQIKVIYINLNRITLQKFSEYKETKPKKRAYIQLFSLMPKAKEFDKSEHNLCL